MKFRKKPVVIEATQWDGTHLAAKQMEAMLGLNTLSMTSHPPSNSVSHWRIGTLEGGHEVSQNDWIITGVKGEHYPCKPDIFVMTYEPVEEALAEYPAPVPWSQSLESVWAEEDDPIGDLQGRLIAEQAAQAQQEPVAWVGCGECDCSFPCTKGGAACIRSSEEPATLADSDRADYEARIKRLGELLTLQHESGERLAARVMELEALADQPAQPAPAAQQEPVAYLHQCGKKPELKSLSFNKHEPLLAAKGYKAIPLTTPQAQPAPKEKNT